MVSDYEDAYDDYHGCESGVADVVVGSYLVCIMSTGGTGGPACAAVALAEYVAGVAYCVNDYEDEIQDAIDNYFMSSIYCYLDNSVY